MYTAWDHALDARRWPVWRFKLEAGTHDELPAGTPRGVRWMQRVRPGVQWLQIELGVEREDELFMDWERPLQFGSREVRAVHRELLALRPPSVSGRVPCLHAADVQWRSMCRSLNESPLDGHA